MASKVRLYQGSGLNISISHSEADLVNATEIEFIINSVPKIHKKLSQNAISGVTANQMTVTIADADTRGVRSGEFRMECRYTRSNGNKVHGRLIPNRISVEDSAFDNVP